MNQELLFYSITISFLGFVAGFLIRGGLTELQRWNAFYDGHVKGMHDALDWMEDARKPAEVIELKRAK